MQTLLIIDMKRRRSSTNTADHGPPSLKPVPNPLLGSSNNGADHGPASQSHIESSLSEGTSSSSSSDSKKKLKARKKHRHKKKHSEPPEKVSRKDKDQKRLNKLLSKNNIVPFIFTGPKRMIPNRMEALPKLPPEIGVSSSKCNGNNKPSTSSELTWSKGTGQSSKSTTSSPSDEQTQARAIEFKFHKTTSSKAAAAAGREAVERKESESAIDALMALGGRTPMASNPADALKSDVGGTAKLE
jgi:hypothetical protein